MRIENSAAPPYWQSQVPLHYGSTVHQTPRQSSGIRDTGGISNTGVTLDISPEAMAASRLAMAESGISRGIDPKQCKTCESRRYQDGSDDPSVSFQSPAHISPGASAAVVAAHEGEHVTNERARAEREGREIVSQTVRLSTAVCPECKAVYVSGGETRTVSAARSEPAAPEEQPASGQV